jgi:DNA-binding response OmpR family regulator
MTQQNTILIVDDEDRLRLSLSLILQKENYRVTTAASAEEALDCLRTQEFDLMFLDLSLPGMSGIDLLVEVHKQVPQMPVLILTAHGGLDSAIQAIRLGARDYLIKPAEPVMILTRVAEILAEREQPARKKEILSQIQALLGELQKMDGEDTPPSALAALPPADPARFLKKGSFELDLHARHAALNGKYIPVSGINFDYLSTLVHHAPRAVLYKTLVKESQGYEVATTIEARDLARWRIHELRKVIETDPERPQYILTVRGEGYRLAI